MKFDDAKLHELSSTELRQLKERIEEAIRAAIRAKRLGAAASVSAKVPAAAAKRDLEAEARAWIARRKD